MAFAKRLVTVQFTLGTGDFGEAGQTTTTVEGLRCTAVITRAGIGYSQAELQIWGMSQSLMNQITVTNQFYYQQRKFNTVTVLAGDDQSGMAVVFTGWMFGAWIDARQQPDVLFFVQASTGEVDLSKTVAPISFNGAVDVGLVINGIAEQMGYSFTNYGVTGTLRNPYLPGAPKSQIEAVCRAVDCMYDVDEASKIVSIWPKGLAKSQAAITISEGTGLIGYPAISQAGLSFSMLFNPGIVIGQQITMQCDFPAANGSWGVAAVQHRLEAQMPGGEWFTDVECWFLQAQQ